MTTVNLNASEMKDAVDSGDPFEAVDEAIVSAVDNMTHGSGDVTVVVVIKNDLEEEIEEDEDEESDEETES